MCVHARPKRTQSPPLCMYLPTTRPSWVGKMGNRLSEFYWFDSRIVFLLYRLCV